MHPRVHQVWPRDTTAVGEGILRQWPGHGITQTRPPPDPPYLSLHSLQCGAPHATVCLSQINPDILEITHRPICHVHCRDPSTVPHAHPPVSTKHALLLPFPASYPLHPRISCISCISCIASTQNKLRTITLRFEPRSARTRTRIRTSHIPSLRATSRRHFQALSNQPQWPSKNTPSSSAHAP